MPEKMMMYLQQILQSQDINEIHQIAQQMMSEYQGNGEEGAEVEVEVKQPSLKEKMMNRIRQGGE